MKVLRHRLRNVLAAMIQNIWHVLHEQRQWLGFTNVMQIAPPQIHSAIHQKRYIGIIFFPAICFGTKLGSPNSSECLAGRPANKHIHLLVYRATDAEVTKDRSRVLVRNVAGLEVGLPVCSMADSRKIGSVGLGSPRVKLN
ncbi:hypothetical protein WK08_28840 [Burkholderia ubonensis]|nr:hypothetical protein WK08_28840 [Burkholderia ubonensis]